MPYDLRHLCEQDSSLLDLNSLAALTNFYRSFPSTAASRSKYDFVITRLFSSADAGRSERHRHLRISRARITKRLTEMCRAWGETPEPDPADAVRLPALLRQFEAFLTELRTIHSLEDFAAKSFFQRVRDFKADLGATLFLPEVTAASVEANITIANYFLWLLELESVVMQQAPEEFHLLADAFSDTYSNEADAVSHLLDELQATNQLDEVAQIRVSRFLRLLQLATSVSEETDLPWDCNSEVLWGESDDTGEAPADLADATYSTIVVDEDDELQAFVIAPESQALMEELQPLTVEPENQALIDELQAFAAQPENQALITAYREASDEVRKLELQCFLSPLPDGEPEELHSEYVSRRTALELIFRADQFVQMELRRDCDPGPDTEVIKARVDKLLDDLGQGSDEMREFINATHNQEQPANYEIFLHVYNQLMAARLRLQSALVRRSAREIVLYDSQEEETTTQLSVQTAPETIQEARSPEGPKNQKTIAPNARRKWLVSAALLLLVAAIGLRFTTPNDKVVRKDDADVVRLAQKEVPNGQMFAEIKLHRDLLLGIATESWLTLSAKEQKEKLQELLRFGQERGAVRVLLVNPQGATVGSATKNDLYVN